MNLKENYRVETSTSTSYFLSKLIDQIHTSYLHLLNKHTRNINTKVYRLSLVMLITFLNLIKDHKFNKDQNSHFNKDHKINFNKDHNINFNDRNINFNKDHNINFN